MSPPGAEPALTPQDVTGFCLSSQSWVAGVSPALYGENRYFSTAEDEDGLSLLSHRREPAL